MPPKRAQENILRHHFWNTVLMVQTFPLNSSYGRRGGHLPQDYWEDTVESSPYTQAFGSRIPLRRESRMLLL